MGWSQKIFLNGFSPFRLFGILTTAYMKIRKITINNLRNHSHTEMEFADGINIISGLNGAGKTTVLEAITICALSKSFLAMPESAIIKSGTDGYYIASEAISDLGIPYKISVGFTKGKRKLIKSSLGDSLLPKEIIGEMPVSVLSPDYKSITFGSPGDRRNFIDKILSQVSRRYIEEAISLKKCLKQRNRILQIARKDVNFDMSLIDPWTEILIKTGAEIVSRRHRFIKEFQPLFEKYYKDVSGGREEVSLTYLPDHISLGPGSEVADVQSLIGQYKTAQGEVEKSELRRGTTLFGPQKDELRIDINGGIAKEYASQGQHKSLLISLKSAEFNYLFEKKQECPIILLDDVFSELDSQRSAKVLELLNSKFAQAFVTVTDPEKLKDCIDSSIPSKYFLIENGCVVNQY